MRGTPGLPGQGGLIWGIIPAHAGNTAAHRWILANYRDHPRACGEHFQHYDVPLEPEGSSPRMRGTHGSTLTVSVVDGIIPAHAGNTNRANHTKHANRDHPRACGEHMSVLSMSAFGTGSSPRMRGTLFLAISGWRGGGIIPAHAGNTVPRFLVGSRFRDHPRACGEHICAFYRDRDIPGSSPRMRGTHGHIFACWCCRGIIPAHAGNTWL